MTSEWAFLIAGFFIGLLIVYLFERSHVLGTKKSHDQALQENWKNHIGSEVEDLLTEMPKIRHRLNQLEEQQTAVLLRLDKSESYQKKVDSLVLRAGFKS